MLANYNITSLSGFHTPATAKFYQAYTGDNIDELRQAIADAREQKLPILVIGEWRNMLFGFDEWPGLVVHNMSKWYQVLKNEENEDGQENTKHKTQNTMDWFSVADEEMNIFRVASGQPIWSYALDLEHVHWISFFHRFLGLPGTIGGSIVGNAGCFWLEIWPYVQSIEILDMHSGDRRQILQEELQFAYRWSACKEHPEWFILSATLDLSTLREKYSSTEEPLPWRERMQPEGYSCWSFFKNPSREQSAGSLIEAVGLKWFHHGWAYFSDKHANFLMSDGTATSADLLQLIAIAQEKIFNQFKIQLEPEVRIILL